MDCKNDLSDTVVSARGCQCGASLILPPLEPPGDKRVFPHIHRHKNNSLNWCQIWERGEVDDGNSFEEEKPF